MKTVKRVSVQVTENQRVEFLHDHLFPTDGKRVIEISLPSRHISTRRYSYPLYNRLKPVDKNTVHVMTSRGRFTWRHGHAAETPQDMDERMWWI